MSKYQATHDIHHNGKRFKPGDWVEISEAEAVHLSSCLEGVDGLTVERAEREAKEAKG